ncbi:hypothetical protein SAMN04488527_1197 [Aliiroseovarius crassostreae]|nr:hypothetical protein SAMN04488527_1197 [Aliiroseovarius crassostreae]
MENPLHRHIEIKFTRLENRKSYEVNHIKKGHLIRRPFEFFKRGVAYATALALSFNQLITFSGELSP